MISKRRAEVWEVASIQNICSGNFALVPKILIDFTSQCTSHVHVLISGVFNSRMRWLVIVLVWWCGTSAVPAPGADPWKCPEIAEQPAVECSCDMPHTLRCTGDKTAMQIIGEYAGSPTWISKFPPTSVNSPTFSILRMWPVIAAFPSLFEF